MFSQEPADLILYGGTIHSADARDPSPQAFAVANGRFVYAGSLDGAMALRGPATTTIDASGCTVLPGLIDAHLHLTSLGLKLERAVLDGARSQEEMVERVASYARSYSRRMDSWPGMGPESLAARGVSDERAAECGDRRSPGGARSRRRARAACERASARDRKNRPLDRGSAGRPDRARRARRTDGSLDRRGSDADLRLRSEAVARAARQCGPGGDRRVQPLGRHRGGRAGMRRRDARGADGAARARRVHDSQRRNDRRRSGAHRRARRHRHR